MYRWPQHIKRPERLSVLTWRGCGPSSFRVFLILAWFCPQQKRDRVSVSPRLAHLGLQRQLPSHWAQETVWPWLYPWSPPRRAGDGSIAAEPKTPKTRACWQMQLQLPGWNQVSLWNTPGKQTSPELEQKKNFFLVITHFWTEKDEAAESCDPCCLLCGSRAAGPGFSVKWVCYGCLSY